MTSTRRRLRVWTTAWLLLQAASLAAFVPGECCTSHRAAERVEPPACHQSAAARRCPMRAASGAACPMHQSDGDPSAETAERCTVGGACAGPMAAMLAQLSQVTVLTEAVGLHPDPAMSPAAAATGSRPTARPAPPDSPPPRA